MCSASKNEYQDIPGGKDGRYVSGVNSQSLCRQVRDENWEYDVLFASIVPIAFIF
jgi:hypothetical protein